MFTVLVLIPVAFYQQDWKTERDLFSTLPLELLHQIFGYNDYKEIVKNRVFRTPISRSFLSFSKSIWYKDVKIKTVRSFTSLCRIILKYPSIGAYIQCIDLRQAVSLEDLTLEEALETIKCLINVKVFRASQIMASILSLKLGAITSLPRLESLDLFLPFAHRKTGWNPRHLRHITLYKNLCSLTLTQTWELLPDPELRAAQAFDKILAKHFGIKLTKFLEGGKWEELSLDGQLEAELQFGVVSTNAITRINVYGSLSRPLLVNLIASYPNLDHLVLSDYSAPKLSILFELLPQANRLLTLDLNPPIELKCKIYEMDYISLLPTLALFTSLTTFLPPPELDTVDLIPFLRDPLPLEHLTLPYGTVVSIKILLDFLQPGSARLSKLKVLTLDVVRGKKSNKRVERLGPNYIFDDGTLEILSHEGFELPEWSTEFSEQGLVDLINFSRSSRVEIKGSSVTALGIVEAHEQQVELAVDIWNSYSDAERVAITRRERRLKKYGVPNHRVPREVDSDFEEERQELRKKKNEERRINAIEAALVKEEANRVEVERIRKKREVRQARIERKLEKRENKILDRLEKIKWGELRTPLEEWEKGYYQEFFLMDLPSR